MTSSDPKSISRETTFERDLHAVRDRSELGGIFTELCVRLAADLARKGMASKTIGIKLRFDDFSIVTRDLTLPTHTLDARAIRDAAGVCLKRVDLTRRLRLLGVRAGTLAHLSALIAPRPEARDAPPGVSRSRRADSRRGSRDGQSLPLFDVDETPLQASSQGWRPARQGPARWVRPTGLGSGGAVRVERVVASGDR